MSGWACTDLKRRVRCSATVLQSSERSDAMRRMLSGRPARRPHSTPNDSKATPGMSWYKNVTSRVPFIRVSVV